MSNTIRNVSQEYRLPTWPRIVDFAIAFLLICAALLKAFSKTDAASITLSYGITHHVMMFVVQIEFLVAALLLSGYASRTCRRIGALLFLSFGIFSLFLALNGESSCGCFGHLKVNPWYVFTLDVTAASLLLRAARYGEIAKRFNFNHIRYVACGYAVSALGTFIVMLSNPPNYLTENSLISEAADLLILEPENWVGLDFPLTEYLTPRVDLEKGESIVLLYHHDCPDCRRAVPKYERLAATTAALDIPLEIVLIEIPPYGSRSTISKAINVRLIDDKEWFVQAPVELRLEEGKITQVSRELASLNAMEVEYYSEM